MTDYILAIDQGTTSSRAIIFDSASNIISVGQQEFTQHFPENGWVEHSPNEIWESTLNVCKEAISSANLTPNQIKAIGITNQRETTIVWDKTTGEAIYNAIVWQDRRTSEFCQQLKQDGLEPKIQEKTGLLLDPYFSATKVNWILSNVPGAQEKAEQGRLAFGTVDSYLLWKLTDGKVHATDATNASRTMLYNINTNEWDEELLSLFKVPKSLLPEVKDSSCDFGLTEAALFGGSIAIGGIAGDQQAALIGQACFSPGMIKSTYGTGCFALMNTGQVKVDSTNRLLTTIAYRLNGETHYALEGSIFMAGAVVQWLRDKLQTIDHAKETVEILRNTEHTDGLYFIPAFTGMGAPYWHADARAAVIGITRDTSRDQIIRAALESVCYQTRDLIEAMSQDGAAWPTQMRVDGGMVNNAEFVNYLSSVLEVTINRPMVTETTALGAAYLAGLQVGVFNSLDDIADQWQVDEVFEPHEDNAHHTSTVYAGWQKMVQGLLSIYS